MKKLKITAAVLLATAAAWAIYRISLPKKRPLSCKSVVTQLWVYPVKSCRGISVIRWSVHNEGFAYDREWGIVDALQGSVLTQRTDPRLTLIETQLDLTEGCLILKAPGMATVLRISLDKECYGKEPLIPCSQWDIDRSARSQGVEASRWLCEFLQRSNIVLVRTENLNVLPTKKGVVMPERSKVRLQDWAPLLLLSEESVEWLKQAVPRAVTHSFSTENFRPNIVVRTHEGKPFREDYWIRFSINENASMLSVKPCARCVIPTNDVHKATYSSCYEPVATLKKYRMSIPPHKKDQKDPKAEPMMGMNVFPTLPMGRVEEVCVGDRVQVHEEHSVSPLHGLGAIVL